MKRRRSADSKEPSNFNAPQTPVHHAPLQDVSFWSKFTDAERIQVTALLAIDPQLKIIRDHYNDAMQNQTQEKITKLDQDTLKMCENHNLYVQYPFLEGVHGAYDFIQRIEDHKRGLERAKGLDRFTLSPSMTR